VRILSYNPGHDGAFAFIEDGRLIYSIESEKDSNDRHAPVSIPQVFGSIDGFEPLPNVICAGGWWQGDRQEYPSGSSDNAGYRGVSNGNIVVRKGRFSRGRIDYFSSSHERSHIMGAFGLSPLPKGTPCYVLVWEGRIGAFYEIDSALNVSLLADVMEGPGARYAQLYAWADTSYFNYNFPPRHSDAGKLMALASFSRRGTPTAAEQELLRFLLDGPQRQWNSAERPPDLPYQDVGLEDQEFRNFAGILSNAIFDVFFRYATTNLNKGWPLLIAGGCGLNCDWNSKWLDTGFFSDVFVPPIANDAGSALGTAIDAQYYFTGNPKVEWNVYAGLEFRGDVSADADAYDIWDASYAEISDLLANDLILGWVSGRYEIGPRALGNRSILAAPFHDRTRVRLNEIKEREQFRPIAPVCLRDDAEKWFGCTRESPHMLFTYGATTRALAAVTHVNGTARLQTVTAATNPKLHDLLVAFKARTGYGVLCNTSLNFKGKGFINNLADLDSYTVKHGLDGFVVEGRAYLLKSSSRYQAYRAR
jgi:predicted NodU family carbamoyl transferase